MLELKRIIATMIAIALALVILPRETALAASGCSVTVTPGTIYTGAGSTLRFAIRNTGDEPIVWLQIQRPSDGYTVTGGTQPGWSDATDENGATLTAGASGENGAPAAGFINPGGSYTAQLTVQAGSQEEGAATWTVRASPGSDGSDMVACDGALDTTISAPPLPPAPNGESGIGLVGIAPASATIAWTSQVASTSFVYYGPADSYGSTASVPGSTTAHQVSLTGLTANTIYHYMVAGSDTGGNSLFSADNTFITPVQPAVAPTASPNAAAVPAGAAAPRFPSVPGDTAPPTVQLTTSLARPFAAPPVISGTAADNGLLARVQYSIDGGRNWLPVTAVTGLGKAQAGFSFTPPVSDEGNYPVLVAATDSNGNEGRSRLATLVIDRLPPQVGPAAISFGPEAITPGASGTLQLLAGTSYRVVAGAVGGATSVVIEARPVPWSQAGSGNFNLTQSPDDGLWNGLLSFKTAGAYQLIAVSRDGAVNLTSRPLMTAEVTAAGRVLEAGGDQPLRSAKLTLHYFEPSTRTWQVWDGAPYSQTNPQVTKADGIYGATVPAGKYFVSVAAPGHRTFTSNSFEVTNSWALASTFRLSKAPRLNIGPFALLLPALGWATHPLPAAQSLPAAATPLPSAQPPAAVTASPLSGAPLPDFNLPTVAGSHERNLDLEGRPTDLVMVTSWSALSQSQLPALAEAGAHAGVNIRPVFSQEHAGLVSVYLATAGYSLTGLVDADGTLTAKLQPGSLPTHVFVDRKGRIKKVMAGVLSKDDILARLGGL